MPDSKFDDATPVTLTVTMAAGEWRALCDHPCLLSEPQQGMSFVAAVHRAVRAIGTARAAALPGKDA